MPGKSEVLQATSEAAALEINPADFRGHSRSNENRGEHGEDTGRSPAQEISDQRRAAKNFQPRQIESQPHAEPPRHKVEVLDVARERDWIPRFQGAGVNENETNDARQNGPKRRAARRRPLNTQKWRLNVRRAVHFLAWSPASHPPCKPNMFFSPASSLSRRATSCLAAQLWLLQ